jgi:hypothetical protein
MTKGTTCIELENTIKYLFGSIDIKIKEQLNTAVCLEQELNGNDDFFIQLSSNAHLEM